MSFTPTRLLLIRHAQSEWNAEGRWQGQADPALSPLGHEQATAVAERLAGERVDRLFSSDLRRARETAEPLGAALGLTPVTAPRLRELDVGEWAGLTREQIERRDPAVLARFDADDPDARPGGGETRREIRLRVRRALADLAAEHAGQRLAIVTHLGVIRALLPGTELENASFVETRADRLASPDGDGSV
ncbi:MAG: histidine phosphatase family protein [Myxococcota bacterium]